MNNQPLVLLIGGSWLVVMVPLVIFELIPIELEMMINYSMMAILLFIAFGPAKFFGGGGKRIKVINA